MNPKNILKKIIPTVLAMATMFVLAMPMKAMADPWCHHDRGRHLGWYKHHFDRDDWDDDDDAPVYNNYYYGNQGYGVPIYGYGRQGGLERRWEAAKAQQQRERALGQRRRAHETSQYLYRLDRQMGHRGGYDPYYGYDNYQPSYGNSFVGPLLGNVLGNW